MDNYPMFKLINHLELYSTNRFRSAQPSAAINTRSATSGNSIGANIDVG
jgi:hypothetical protein